MKQTVMPMLALIALLSLTACNGGGGSSSGGTATATSSTGTGTTATPGSGPIAAPQTSTGGTIRLSAFSDFSCSGNWTNRDGALGLKAGSGSGSCQASFPGPSGTYAVQVKIQTECDGASPYQVSINGNTVHSGRYPYASGGLQCDKSHSECPDRNKVISVGTFTISNGSSIGFSGSEHYGCGEHGAYAKWHEMTFRPAG